MSAPRRSLFDVVDAKWGAGGAGGEGAPPYHLVAQYPRRVIERGARGVVGDVSLAELGLGGNEVLLVDLL